MNIQRTLLGLFLTIFLIVSSSGLPTTLTDANATTTNSLTTFVTTQMTTSNFTNITQTTTVAPITTTRVTNATTTSLTNSSTAPTTITTSLTSATTNSTVPTKKSTKPVSPSPKSPGRKFDGLSFVGGMILAVGLGAIIYLVVSYTRRNGSQLPYSNLR